ncbi:MAG: cyclic nucleotide-binding/CBS domain-containing protein [Candidatus Binatia bacterium]
MAGIDTLMVTRMVTATPYETVAQVVQRMSSNKVGAVLIMDRNTLWGLFSERDLLTRVVREQRDPRTTDVGDVATRDVVTVDVNAPLKAVLAVFRERKFRHLPVMRAGKPAGILSTRDFLDFLVEGLERYIDDMKYKRDLAQGIDPYDHLGGAYGR